MEERIGDGAIIRTLRDASAVEATTLSMHSAMFSLDVVKLWEKEKMVYLQERIEIHHSYTKMKMKNSRLKELEKKTMTFPPMITQGESSKSVKQMQALKQKVIDFQQKMQVRDRQIMTMESMMKGNVLTVIKGTLSHLLKIILNKIEDVYKYFCILSEGVV